MIGLLLAALVLPQLASAQLKCTEIPGYWYQVAAHDGDDLGEPLIEVTSDVAAQQCSSNYQCTAFTINDAGTAVLKAVATPVTPSGDYCVYTKVLPLPKGVPRRAELLQSCSTAPDGGWRVTVSQDPYSTEAQDESNSQTFNSGAVYTGQSQVQLYLYFNTVNDCLTMESCIAQTGNFYQLCPVTPTLAKPTLSNFFVQPDGRFGDILNSNQQQQVTCPVCEYKYLADYRQYVKSCCSGNKPKCCGTQCCKNSNNCCAGSCCSKRAKCCNNLFCCPGGQCCGFSCCNGGQKCCGNKCVPKNAPC